MRRSVLMSVLSLMDHDSWVQVRSGDAALVV